MIGLASPRTFVLILFFTFHEIIVDVFEHFESAVFLRKESTIVMAFRQCFFFRYTSSDQNSSTKSSTEF